MKQEKKRILTSTRPTPAFVPTLWGGREEYLFQKPADLCAISPLEHPKRKGCEEGETHTHPNRFWLQLCLHLGKAPTPSFLSSYRILSTLFEYGWMALANFLALVLHHKSDACRSIFARESARWQSHLLGGRGRGR